MLHVRLRAADPHGRREHGIEPLSNRLADEVSEKRIASQWQVTAMTFNRTEWDDRRCDTSADYLAQLGRREFLQLHTRTLAAGPAGRTARCRIGRGAEAHARPPLAAEEGLTSCITQSLG